jgi:hypothetical protein
VIEGGGKGAALPMLLVVGMGDLSMDVVRSKVSPLAGAGLPGPIAVRDDDSSVGILPFVDDSSVRGSQRTEDLASSVGGGRQETSITR